MDATPASVMQPVPTSTVLGLQLSRLSFVATMQRIERMLDLGQSSFFITAPLNYAMMSHRHANVRDANKHAAFIVADGMPLVWLSKLSGTPIEERVAGADLVPAMCELAYRRGQGVFFLGGAPGVADLVAQKMTNRFPGFQVAGTACPNMSELSDDDERKLIASINHSNAAFLFFAKGQPDGEVWLARNYEKLGCISVQVGASLDFIANGVERAPRWMQRTGTEWLYRLAQEPRRLSHRYFTNFVFFLAHAPKEIAKALITHRFHNAPRYYRYSEKP